MINASGKIAMTSEYPGESIALELAQADLLWGYIDSLTAGVSGKYLHVSTSPTKFSLASGMIVWDSGVISGSTPFVAKLNQLYQASPAIWTLVNLDGTDVNVLKFSSFYAMQLTVFNNATYTQSTLNLSNTNLRTMSGIASGTIKMSNFYGKTWKTLYSYITAGTYYLNVPFTKNKIDALLIGGGGGGARTASTKSASSGGGGGGGEVITKTCLSVPSGYVITIVVGAGGASATGGTNSNIQFAGSYAANARGGSVVPAGMYSGAASGSGYPGGTGSSSASGGGGGDSGPGGNYTASPLRAGDGGAATAVSFNGITGSFGGGGGGAGWAGVPDGSSPGCAVGRGGLGGAKGPDCMSYYAPGFPGSPGRVYVYM